MGFEGLENFEGFVAIFVLSIVDLAEMLLSVVHLNTYIYTHVQYIHKRGERGEGQMTLYDIGLYFMHTTYSIHCTTHAFLCSGIQYVCHICKHMFSYVDAESTALTTSHESSLIN